MIPDRNRGVEIRPGFKTRATLEHPGECTEADAKRHNRISMAATQDPYDRKWGVVALLCVIAAVNYVDRTAISTVLPLLRADLHITDVQIAAAGTCFLWSYALGCPFSGYLSDRLRRGRVVFWSLLLWSGLRLLLLVLRLVLLLRLLLGGLSRHGIRWYSRSLLAVPQLLLLRRQTRTRSLLRGRHQAGDIDLLVHLAHRRIAHADAVLVQRIRQVLVQGGTVARIRSQRSGHCVLRRGQAAFLLQHIRRGGLSRFILTPGTKLLAL